MDKEYIEEIWGHIYKLFSNEINYNKDLEGMRLLQNRWYRNKRWLMPYFDEKGRRSILIEGTIEDVTSSDIRAAFDSLDSMRINMAKKDRFAEVLQEDEGKDAIEWLKMILLHNFSAEEIASNRVSRDIRIGSKESCKEMQKGTKLTKIIASFIEMGARNHMLLKRYDLSNEKNKQIIAEYMTTFFSQVLSSLKPCDSKVVVSINPMDILLGSTHTTGWRSCHDIFTGAWRTGQISYLLDKTSAIAYAYTDEEPLSQWEYTVPNQPRKLWRQMVYFNKDVPSALLSREYPGYKTMYSMAATEVTKEIINEISGNKKELEVLSVYTTPRFSSKFIIDAYEWHYTDSPRVLIKPTDVKMVSFKNGVARIPCFLCGSQRGASRNEHYYAICRKCREEYSCESCGWYHSGHLIDVNGKKYCKTCFDAIFATCNCCGQLTEKRTKFSVKDADGESYYVCEDCAKEHYHTCTYCGRLETKKDAVDVEFRKFCRRCSGLYTSLCIKCGKRFLSRKLTKKGMCQGCQDEVFAANMSKQLESVYG